MKYKVSSNYYDINSKKLVNCTKIIKQFSTSVILISKDFYAPKLYVNQTSFTSLIIFVRTTFYLIFIPTSLTRLFTSRKIIALKERLGEIRTLNCVKKTPNDNVTFNFHTHAHDSGTIHGIPSILHKTDVEAFKFFLQLSYRISSHRMNSRFYVSFY